MPGSRQGGAGKPLHALHCSGQEEMSHLIGTQPQRAPFCQKGDSSKWLSSIPPLAAAEREVEENVLGSDPYIREIDSQVTL